MRRLRFAAALTSALEAEFGDDARDRRHAHYLRAAADPNARTHALVALAGPETPPPECFTPEHWARALEGRRSGGFRPPRCRMKLTYVAIFIIGVGRSGAEGRDPRQGEDEWVS
jgi:hypothetical protein